MLNAITISLLVGLFMHRQYGLNAFVASWQAFKLCVYTEVAVITAIVSTGLLWKTF